MADSTDITKVRKKSRNNDYIEILVFFFIINKGKKVSTKGTCWVGVGVLRTYKVELTGYRKCNQDKLPPKLLSTLFQHLVSWIKSGQPSWIVYLDALCFIGIKWRVLVSGLGIGCTRSSGQCIKLNPLLY